ncbi:translation initiation factor IF-3, mitochondrial isoform X2 [Scleropages formosus]|nr:translation initiation factor IF-3, mitochondrial isoform X2 [Scleropages formosus]
MLVPHHAPLGNWRHLDNTVHFQCWAHKALTGTGGLWGVAAFTSSPGSTEGASGRQRKDPQARSTVGSVGRRIHQRHLQVIGVSGEDLGTMHRADVIRLMDQEGLKLVPVNLSQEPPIYRLMTGKQIHEEQLKLREKQKNKAGPVLLKELTLFTDIGPHDLHTKLRQVQSWLERRHHVRVTLKKGSRQGTNSLDEELERIVQGLPEAFSFISKPQLIRDGKAAFCILRTASEKSSQQLRTTKKNSLNAGTSGSQPRDEDHPLEGQVTSPEQ